MGFWYIILDLDKYEILKKDGEPIMFDNRWKAEQYATGKNLKYTIICT